MKPLWKLLRSHLSVAQTVGFALAGVVGMTVVLTALQAYRDVMSVFRAPDSFVRGDYLVLSKRVGTLQTFGLGGGGFSDEELRDLREQPFVREVGAFVPAEYRVKGSVGAGGVGFSTYLFFESVPDRFLDVQTEAWRFDPAQREIPIIIPRNYLNLYNFGFARSQGLPQISEGLFKRVTLDVELSGAGRSEHFRGRIVGLSNRLNTILVPESFIRWSNERFGGGSAAKEPLRVIVETDGPADERLTTYLADKGYEAEGGAPDDGRAVRLVRLAASGVAGVGLVFSVMAFYMLLLSIFLLLQKESRKLETLLLLGYRPGRIALPYVSLTLGLNLAVWCGALLLGWVIRAQYLPLLETMQEGYRPAGVALTLLCGLVLALLLTALNAVAIRRRIGRLGMRKE